jgi:hypothetical protein
METIPWIAIFAPLWSYFLVLLGSIGYFLFDKRKFLHHALQDLPQDAYNYMYIMLFTDTSNMGTYLFLTFLQAALIAFNLDFQLMYWYVIYEIAQGVGTEETLIFNTNLI